MHQGEHRNENRCNVLNEPRVNIQGNIHMSFQRNWSTSKRPTQCTKSTAKLTARLRNSNFPGSDASLEDFGSCGNPIHSQAVRELQPIQSQPMQNPHVCPMQNAFYHNINSNQTQNLGIYQPPTPGIYFNGQLYHQQQQMWLPPQQQPPSLVTWMPQYPENAPHSGFPIDFQSDSITSHGNPFIQTQNIAQNHMHFENCPRETGDADLSRHMRREEDEIERAQRDTAVMNTPVPQPQNIVIKKNQEFAVQRPNQNKTTQNKDNEKEKTASTAKITHFDNTFRGIDWYFTPVIKPIGIPKLNNQNTNPGTTNSSDDKKCDLSKNNVSKSKNAVKSNTTEEKSLEKTPQAAKKPKISIDDIKSNKKVPAMDHAHADTTNNINILEFIKGEVHVRFW